MYVCVCVRLVRIRASETETRYWLGALAQMRAQTRARVQADALRRGREVRIFRGYFVESDDDGMENRIGHFAPDQRTNQTMKCL